MAEQEACAELVQQASEQPTARETTEGESLLLPLLQGLLQDKERDADRRAGLIAEVQSALDKLSKSLSEDETDMPADKRDSLLHLVDKLKAGLSAAVPARATDSGPEVDRLTAKKRTRQDRHTVGVSSEELADARKLIEEISRCKLVENAKPKPFNAELKVHQVDEQKSPSIEPVPEDQEPKLSVNPIYAKPESSRFNTQLKKLKMKRANTIDIPKPAMQQHYDEGDYSDDERLRSQNYYALRGPVRVGDPVSKRVVPEFRPKTASDQKFLAFLNKNTDRAERDAKARSSMWTEQANRVSIWGNRFGNIKNKFEIEPKTSKINDFDRSSAFTGKLVIKPERPMPVNQFSHAPQSAFKPIAPSRRVETPDQGELIKTEIKDAEADKSLFLYSPKPLDDVPVASCKPWLTPSHPESGGGRVLSMAAKKFEPQQRHQDLQKIVKPRKLSREFTEPFDRQPEYTSRTTVVYQLPDQSPVIKQQIPPTIKRQPESTTAFKPFTTPTIKQQPTQLSPTIKQLAPTFRQPPLQPTHLISPTIEQQSTQLSPTFRQPTIQIPAVKQQQPAQVSPTIKQQLSPTFRQQPTHLISPTIEQQSTQLSPTFRQPTIQIPTIKQQQPTQVSPTIKQLSPTFRQPPIQPTSPTIKYNTSPQPQQYSPMMNQQYSSVINQQSSVFNQQSSPMVNQQSSHSVNQQSSPLVNQQSSPLVNQQSSPVVNQQSPPPAGPPPKYETQLSSESVHEYTAISSKVMGGAQQAVTVKQGPKTRNEHDMEAALTLKNSLAKTSYYRATDEGNKSYRNFPGKLSSRSFGSKDVGDSSRLGVVKPMQKVSQRVDYDDKGRGVVTSRFHIPVVNVEPGSPLAKSDSWHRIVEKPAAAPGRQVVKSKSSHSLAVPQRQYEAGMSKDELAHKRKAMEAYLSSGKTVVKTSINRIKTSEKQSACAGNKSSGITRSRTLPDIVCPILDESNVDQAFEDLFKSTCA